MNGQLDTLMHQAINQGVFAGATVLIACGGQAIYQKSFGYAVRYKNAQKESMPILIRATNDMIYDIASLTKIFTAVAVMLLKDQGKVDLDDPVVRYLPAFGVNGKEKITVRQLLSHTSGLPASMRLDTISGKREDRIQAVMEAKTVAQPGTVVKYSDIGFIVLGELVAKVSGVSLDRFVENAILRPLGMSSTRYRPPQSLKPWIVATEWQEKTKRGLVWGEVHDENAWALDGVAGHAGLFSTAEDLWKIGRLFLQKGVWRNQPFLKKETVQEMVSLQTKNIQGTERGLGFELNQDWYMGPFAFTHAFGHTGFTGTSLFLSPGKQVAVILLTNRVHPTRTGPNINRVRKKVAEIAWSLVTSP
jgi:CubicO group peptidase (beta-lactamase class C family)